MKRTNSGSPCIYKTEQSSKKLAVFTIKVLALADSEVSRRQGKNRHYIYKGWIRSQDLQTLNLS